MVPFLFSLNNKTRKNKETPVFCLASFHNKIIVPTNCSQRTALKLQYPVLLIIDFQYEYVTPIRWNPRESPSNTDHETIYSQRLTPIEFEIPRGVLI